MLKFLFIMAVGQLTFHAFGEELDKYSVEALEKTQEMLQRPDLRHNTIKDNPDAERVDNQVNDLVGGDPQDKEKLYRIAASIMEKITKENGGDPQKMMEKMLEAQKNPEEFYKTFGAEHKDAIKQLGESIESRKRTQPNH